MGCQQAVAHVGAQGVVRPEPYAAGGLAAHGFVDERAEQGAGLAPDFEEQGFVPMVVATVLLDGVGDVFESRVRRAELLAGRIEDEGGPVLTEVLEFLDEFLGREVVEGAHGRRVCRGSAEIWYHPVP